MPETTTVGLISDTHGLMRPEAIEALRGSDLIIHAGDVGDPGVLAALATLAPVRTIRGNIDKAPWAETLPETEVVEIGGTLIYVIHRLDDLDFDPAAAGFRAVIHGHSHQPTLIERDGVMFANPGSAGPRRFSLPITVATLVIQDDALSVALIDLAPRVIDPTLPKKGALRRRSEAAERSAKPNGKA